MGLEQSILLTTQATEVESAEVQLPAGPWKRLRIAGIEYNTSASELLRRGARLALHHVEEHG